MPSRSSWRRLRPTGRNILLIFLGSTALAGTIGLPAITAPALLVVLGYVIWERRRIRRSLGKIAALIAADDVSSKLEVRNDALAEVHHALNRLMQQRRSEHRLRDLLPTLPPSAAHIPTPPNDGTPQTVLVLSATLDLPPHQPRFERLRVLCAEADRVAQAYEALLFWSGEALVLVFGLFDAPPSAHAALRVARALQRTTPHLSLTLTCGEARALVLPGTGLIAVGPPISAALHLHQLSPHQPEASLLCNEAAYLQIRPVLTEVQRISANSAITYVAHL